MPSSDGSGCAFFLVDEAPNNAITRHYGVWDVAADDYATTTTGSYCYGMTHDEAVTALALLDPEADA